jgi:hypothetical protein
MLTSSFKDDHVCVQFIPPNSASACKTNIRCVLCIDNSGSMGNKVNIKDKDGKELSYDYNVMNITQHSANTFVNCLDDTDKVSVVTFSDLAYEQNSWVNGSQENKQLVNKRILEIRPLTSTNYCAGLTKSFEMIQNDVKKDLEQNDV